MNNIKTISMSLVLISLLGLSGCGGSSSTEESQETTTSTTASTQDEQQEALTVIKGTVALGSGASSHITLIGSNTHQLEGTSSDNGTYEIDASSLSEPIMVKAVLDATGDILYSFASANTGIVNITPLTTYTIDQAAVASGVTGGASQLFQSFEAGDAPSQLAQNVTDEEQQLNNVIGGVMRSNGVTDFNHFTSEFSADHSGYDAVLDDLDIELYQDDVIIREGNETLDTLNYDINVSDINITGKVFDISTNEAIDDANITFTDSAGHIKSAVSDENGTFLLAIETMRVYDIKISATGFQTQSMPDVPSFVFTESNVGDIAMIPAGDMTETALTGSVIDGRTVSTVLANTSLTFREGYGNRVGDVVATTTTDAQGQYTLNLTSGVYTVEITHDDYYPIFREITVYGDESVSDFSLLSNLTASTDFFATITLNWDNAPSDLDSHLTGPMANSDERFHMSYVEPVIDVDGSEDAAYLNSYRDAMQQVTGTDYSNTDEDRLWDEYSALSDEDRMSVDTLVNNNEMTPCGEGEIATLDRDRTDDYEGLYPETTTLCKVENGGLYKYYVNNYSGDASMSSGHAQVTVSTANGMSYTFNAPSSTVDESSSDYTGNVWHVFNIDADGNIYPVNEMIGNGHDEDDAVIFSAPTRLKTDTRFSADKDLLKGLPKK